MPEQRTYVFAGGDPGSIAYLKTFEYAGSFLVAVDRGLNVMNLLGLVPDLFVGDGDSAAPELLTALDHRRTHVVLLPEHKDVSDLEAAFDLLIALGQRGDMVLLAGLGGRMDHLMFNLLLAARHVINFHSIVFEDGRYTARPLADAQVLQLPPGTTVSFVPVTREIELTLVGFEYPLTHDVIQEGSTRTLSNVVRDPIQQVIVDKGTAMMIARKVPGDIS